MTALGLVVIILATHRLTRLATQDTITAGLRERLAKRATKRMVERRQIGGQIVGEQVVPNPNASRFTLWLHRLASCHWCLSIWTGGGTVALWHYQGSWFRWVAEALAASSAASIVHERL